MTVEQSYIFDARYDFPCTELPAKTYLICSAPRAGTHFLAHLLWSTGALGSPSEYFLSSLIPVWNKRFGVDCYSAAFKEIVTRRTSPNGWFGAALHWEQLETMKRTKIPESICNIEGFVFLSREDRLAQAISLEIAIQTGRWISLDSKRRDAVPVYDRAAIDRHLLEIDQQLEAWRQFRQELAQPWIQLSYESVVEAPQSAVDQVAAMLGIDTPTTIGSIPIEIQSTALNKRWRDWYLTEQPASNQLVETCRRENRYG
jgi:LPS sulfotransferase NodH